MSWYVTHILSFNDPWSYPSLLAFPVEVLSLFFALHFSLIQAFWVLGNCSATAHSIFTNLLSHVPLLLDQCITVDDLNKNPLRKHSILSYFWSFVLNSQQLELLSAQNFLLVVRNSSHFVHVEYYFWHFLWSTETIWPLPVKLLLACAIFSVHDKFLVSKKTTFVCMLQNYFCMKRRLLS